MLDKELTILIIATIKAGLAARGINGVAVMQGNQPTQQGVPTGPMVALYQFPSRRYGWMRRADVWVPPVGEVAGYMAHQEVQKMETTFQVTALYPQLPENTGGLTACDLANTVADILQSDAGLAQLRAVNAGIYRVTDIRLTAFVDDRDRFEYSPNFDFTVTHQNERVTMNPAVSTYEARIHST